MSAPVFQIEFTQDIKKPVLVQHCGNVVFTGDNLSDTISVSVLEDGEPYAISGTVAMNCIRADGATVTVTGSVIGNTASATLTQACVAIPGPLAVVIKVTSDTTTTTLLKAVYMVDVGVTGTAVDPGTIIPDVTTLINAIETAVGSIPSDYSDLLATIAPNFVSGTYNKDQYVWNNGTLYRFTENHSGSWTGTDVESVVIGGELTNLKSALSEEVPLPLSGSTVVQGTFNTTGAVVVQANRIRYTGYVPVSKGSKIKFTGGTNTTQLLLGIFDTAKVYKRDSQWYNSGAEIAVENDGYYIFVFRKNSSNANISPSEYDATTVYIPSLENRIETVETDIDNLTDEVRSIWYEKTFHTVWEWNYFNYDFIAGEKYAVVTRNSTVVTAYTATSAGANIETVPVNINGTTNITFTPSTSASILKLYGPQTSLTIRVIKLDSLIQEYIDNKDILPAYYFDNGYIENKVDTIINKSPLDGFQFAFITDVHVRSNAGKSPLLLNYIKSRSNSVPFIVFGGDVMTTQVPDGVAPLDDAIEWQTWLDKMGKSEVYQAQGNHDYLVKYYDDGQQTWYYAPLSVCRQLIIGNLENKNIVCESGKLWYYFDIPTANTRIIVLNDYDTPRNDGVFYGYNGMSVDQVQWVVDKALDTDGIRVIFVSHQTYDSEMEGENQQVFVGMQSLFKAIANHTNYSYGAITKDFTNSNIKFVAHLCGHWHADASNVDDNVPTIQTTCDGIMTTGAGRAICTITEQAFDIVTVDYTNSKLYTTRIGAGNDREFDI